MVTGKYKKIIFLPLTIPFPVQNGSSSVQNGIVQFKMEKLL